MTNESTHLTEGDILRIGNGRVRWEVTGAMAQVRNPQTNEIRYLREADIRSGHVRRWNGIPILPNL